MSRHRHIRSLDIKEEYYDLLYEDDVMDENCPSAIAEDIDLGNPIPQKSNLSDFIDISLTDHKTLSVQGFKRASPVKHRGPSKKCTRPISGKKEIDSVKLDCDMSKIISKCNYSFSHAVHLPMGKSITEDLTNDSPSSSFTLGKSDDTLETDLSSGGVKQKANKVKTNLIRSSDCKPLINIVVTGHVDAGKSTLFGNLLFKLGYINQKTMRKCTKESELIGKASFAYAWLLDESSEERRRGITMDIAHQRFETSEHEVVLLDAPGHKDFIHNMISGAADADASVLVLNSTFGEFETGFEMGGQTKEHIILARSLGINQVIVVVNKMDNVDWSKDRYDEIVSKILPFLCVVGFKNAKFVPCSGLLGENVIAKSASVMQWYNGPTLLNAISQLKPPERPFQKTLRMFISDLFKDGVKGFNISGTISSGSIRINDKVKIMPLNHPCMVSRITVNHELVQCSFAGDRVDVQVTGIDHSIISKGHVLCCDINPITASSRFRSRLLLFEISVPLTQGSPVIFHQHSCSEPAVVTKLISLLHKTSGQVLQKKPRFLLGNNCAIVEITVAKPVCIDLYEKVKEFGRFLLRSEGNTIAAGTISKIF